MIENDHDHDLGALIKQGYSLPLPGKPFVESLGASLCRELQSLPGQSEQVAQVPRRRPAAAMRRVVGSVIRHRRLALATAAAVVVALLALPFVVPRTTDEQSGGAGVPSGEAEVLTAAPQPSTEPVRQPSSTSVGERRPEAAVAEASVIVRAKATRRTRAAVEYRVTKVFKGKLTEDLITVQIPETRAGAPHDPEKKYAIGQEVILFLSGFRKTKQGAIWNASSWWYDVAPGHRLDDREKIILAAIAKARPPAADDMAAQPDRTWPGITRRGVRTTASRARLTPAAYLADKVSQASAVVRGQMMKLTDTHLVCKVTRLIYGRNPGDLVHVPLSLSEARTATARRSLERRLHREPTDAEVKAYLLSFFKVGREVILVLGQGRQTEAGVECPCLIRWSVSNPQSRPVPREYLDRREKEIFELVKSGKYLVPGPMPLRIRASERVVRAKLTKIGQRSTDWQITRVLHVRPAAPGLAAIAPAEGQGTQAQNQGPPATITLDTWRLRAEAIVRYRAAREPGQASTEKKIQEEFARLVGAELALGREAILFLGPKESAGGKGACKLIGILHGDSDDPDRIEQLEKQVRVAKNSAVR